MSERGTERASREVHPASFGKITGPVPKACPRCEEHEWIPNNLTPGAYVGALSRADNKTEICSRCGEDEALKDYFESGCEPVEEWPVSNTKA